MPRSWEDPGTNSQTGYNPRPYRGRPTDSHKRKGGGSKKPPKGSSGKGNKAAVVIAWALLGVPTLVFAVVIGALLHGHNVF